MERFVLTDAQWAKMEPHCLGKPTDPGRSGSDNRRFVEAVLWIVRTGSPWRDLPAFFGMTDALGNLVRFVLLPGHRFDTVGVAPLIDGLTFGGFIADKAFDSNSIIADLNERGAAEHKPAVFDDDCQAWLEREMRASPQRTRPKAYWRARAMEKFGVSARAFDRMWPNAIKNTGAHWDRAGAPSKVLRNPSQ